MLRTVDVRLDDGRVLRAYDSGADAAARLVLMWHHGSPQTGAPLAPVLAAAAARGIRVLSYARPAYGGSTPQPGRDVASAAADAAAVAEAFGVARFAAMGASGGGPHALAGAALLPDRVTAVVTLAAIAPWTDAFDWFDGMQAPGGLRAAMDGREARAGYAETEEFDPEQFLPADFAALDGPWSALGDDVARSAQFGPDGLIDDDVAFAKPWGFELEAVRAPVLLVQGEGDRVVPRRHASWMLGRLPRATLWMRLDDGHVSVLDTVPDAMDWLLERGS
ncbi:pimeloyl-ACP methyl ester carboxylesterase [Agromyces ramosus]|uniref:Pimeloyl-ACP methyl ester carboxylesterase n=1 Tax=Agromyces ramosus TaxID=33879 RepID=A0A4Q7MN45_9MICO|nr:alpha/beta hydrolase [Agromyces ramosus]RZS68202.1 pimeloyl-ACP methyl ester carboxylesterase [Agromyces ramosus]